MVPDYVRSHLRTRELSIIPVKVEFIVREVVLEIISSILVQMELSPFCLA